jgi:2-dehydro-3-deoxyphosphogluconate aldolase / (4S)-4-hydroxy-2-oxoglutarate aldolase
MSRYTRIETLNAMYETGLCVVFYHPDPEIVVNVVSACAEGGARLVELTNRGDSAYKVFEAMEEHCACSLPEMITGVGSIVDGGTASLYINSGANFIVGPVLNSEVARVCNRRKIPYSPGCGTVSEISQAEELGCEIIKVFPGGQVGGPAFVKAVKGPCPWTALMPTGGVDITEQSLREWYEAGIVCAGIGSKLVTKDLLKNKDYKGITENVSRTIRTIAKLKEEQK